MLTPPIEYRKGAKRVPGRVVDKGRRDTVKAILAPGEAVLNVQAAERLGREKIAALNREGLRERGEGLPPEQARSQKTDDKHISGLERAMYEHADTLHPVKR